MKTKVDPAAENEVALSVEIPADAVRRAYDRTLSALRNELEIPGFRKGRVPRNMVVAHFGEDVIREQTLEDAIPRWGEEAMKDAGVFESAVSTSDLSTGPLDENADYSFTLRVQTMPTPVLGDYMGVEAPKRAAEVTDEQIDAQMDLNRERLAQLQPVEGRPTQAGDYVIMDLEARSSGKTMKEAQGKGQMFQLGDTQLIPGFEEQMYGLSVGDEKEFSLTLPDDYRDARLAGQEADFKAKVVEIKEKVLPALDDAFAADVSDFTTLADLRADIAQRMETIAAEAAERDFRSAVVDKVTDGATVSVPKVMIDREAHRLYHELEEDVTKRGVNMNAYLGVIEKTKEEAEAGLRPRAEQDIKRRLVLNEIAKAEGLSVSDDDIVAAIKHDAEVWGRDYLELLGDIRKAGRQDDLRAELLVVKTIDFLVAKAVPTEMTASEVAAVEAAEDEAATVEAAIEEAADASPEQAE
ncbi:MAG: trigger factor [Thermoleophilia bacterium]